MSPICESVPGKSGFPFKRTLAAAFVAGLLGAVAPAWAAGNDHPAPTRAELAQRATLEQRARDLSTGLVRSMKALERAPASERSQRAREVAQTAAERRAAMLALVEADPGRALAQAMPKELRDRLPQEARNLVEEEVSAEGIVVGMLIDDIERGVSKHPVFLEYENASGRQRLSLHSADSRLSEVELFKLIDRRVRVRALRIGDQLVVGDQSQVEMAEASGKGKSGGTSGGDSGSTGTMAEATGPVVSGDQRTLVIATNFSDSALTCSTTDIKSRLFGTGASVDQILRQSSRDATSVSGDVVGPFTIPYSASGSCDYYAWSAAADAAAKAAGIDISRYTRISYATPRNSSCSWAGIANVGGSAPTRSWVTHCGVTGLYAHEISHNLRFHHASTPSSEYGDNSDPMGYSNTVLMNAANRVMAGWLPASNVVDAGASGSYTIGSLSGADLGIPQVVRLRKTDTNEYYYLSLRQSEGLDSGMSSAYKNAISVHRASGTLPSKTVLLAVVQPGQSWTDAVNGIGITTQSVGTGSATVSIAMAGPTCSRAAPTVSLAPAAQSGAPGSAVRYSVSITNRDSSACSSSIFAFGQALPTGFSGSFGSASISLAPGASANVDWSVASASSATDGSYGIEVSAAASGSSPASTKGSYVVYSDGSAPTVSISYPQQGATVPAKPLTLSASAFDDGGVARVDFFVNGALVGSSSTAPYQVRWNARKAKGGNTVTARAVDNAGNQTEASVSFTVK